MEKTGTAARASTTTIRRAAMSTSIMIGYPAPPELAKTLFAQGTICKLVARYAKQGMSMSEAIAQTARGNRGL